MKMNPKEKRYYCIICKSLDCACNNPAVHKRMFWGKYENYAREADLSAICDMLKWPFEKKVQYLKLKGIKI